VSSQAKSIPTQQPGETTRRIASTVAYYAAFVGLGLISASLGPTLPALAEQTQTALREISFLFTGRATGYLIGSLVGGRVYDRMPGHPVLGVALLVMAAGMFATPLLPNLWPLAGVLLLIGIAEGTLDVGGNTLLVWLHRAKVGPYMNALHFFFGLGAAITPLVVAWALAATGGIRWAYWLLGLYAIPVALALFPLKSPVAEHTEQQAAPEPINLRLVGLVALFMFLYVGAEVGVGGWLYTYAVALKLASETSAALLTSVFWAALTVGRLLAIPVAAFVRPRIILTADLAGVVASIALMVVGAGAPWTVWAGAAGAGLFMASIFPTIITWAGRRMRVTGAVTGWFFVGSSTGSMSIPWLIGQLFDAYGPHATMITILICTLLACAVFAAMMAAGGRPHLEE
jgi:fucose permease